MLESISKGKLKSRSSPNRAYFGKFSKIEKIIYLFTEIKSQSIQLILKQWFWFKNFEEASLRKISEL